MTVTTLGRSTAQTIGLVLSDAFRDEALAAWIVPDPVARPVLLARLFALTTAQALTDGTVDIIDDPRPEGLLLHRRDGDPALPRQFDGSGLEAVGELPGRGVGRMVGAALWFDYSRPADVPHEPDPAMTARVVEVLGRDAAGRWQTAMTAMGERHPRCSHQYLALIGVSDDRQRRGLGAGLLRHRLRALDNTVAGAYLEATSRASRAFYTRWGFRELGRPLVVPDGGPTLWPMFRDPYPADRPADPGAGTQGTASGVLDLADADAYEPPSPARGRDGVAGRPESDPHPDDGPDGEVAR